MFVAFIVCYVVILNFFDKRLRLLIRIVFASFFYPEGSISCFIIQTVLPVVFEVYYMINDCNWFRCPLAC